MEALMTAPPQKKRRSRRSRKSRNQAPKERPAETDQGRDPLVDENQQPKASKAFRSQPPRSETLPDPPSPAAPSAHKNCKSVVFAPPDKEAAKPDKSKTSSQSPLARQLKSLTTRANTGDEAALRELREFIDKNPEIWQIIGDLSRNVERAWLDRLAENDFFVIESVKRYLVDLKSRLAGPSPTPLESLLVTHVGSTWLAAQHGEWTAANPDKTPIAVATFRLRQAESAQRRHLAAVRTLALVRSLGPAALGPSPVK